MPIVRKEVNLFLERDFVVILFTKCKLKMVHLHFFQPSTKFFNLINHAHADRGGSEFQNNLHDISQACETCPRHLQFCFYSCWAFRLVSCRVIS